MNHCGFHLIIYNPLFLKKRAENPFGKMEIQSILSLDRGGNSLAGKWKSLEIPIRNQKFRTPLKNEEFRTLNTQVNPPSFER